MQAWTFFLFVSPCHPLELPLGPVLLLGALLAPASHLPEGRPSCEGGSGRPGRVSLAALTSAWVPGHTGTAWHECPLLPSPSQQLLFPPYPSGQKWLIQVVNEQTRLPPLSPSSLPTPHLLL